MHRAETDENFHHQNFLNMINPTKSHFQSEQSIFICTIIKEKHPELLTMFLASYNVLRPITSVCLFVVEKSTNAELFGGSAVPAGPVPGAGRLVTEDAV